MSDILSAYTWIIFKIRHCSLSTHTQNSLPHSLTPGNSLPLLTSVHVTQEGQHKIYTPKHTHTHTHTHNRMSLGNTILIKNIIVIHFPSLQPYVHGTQRLIKKNNNHNKIKHFPSLQPVRSWILNTPSVRAMEPTQRILKIKKK